MFGKIVPAGPVLCVNCNLYLQTQNTLEIFANRPVSTLSKRNVLFGIPLSIRSCWYSPLEHCLAVYMTFSQHES